MHGLGFLVILGIRLLVYWGNKRAGRTGRPQPAWLARLGGWGAVSPAVLGLGVRGGFLLSSWLVALNGNRGWAVFLLIFALPQLVLQALLIPAGVPFCAYYFTRVLHPQATLGETRGGAVFNELRARLRWGWQLGRASTKTLTVGLVEFGTNLRDRSVRAASLAARAMLDAIEGDREHARELFGAVQMMSIRHGARSARVYSQAWLLSEAARRGAYHEVIRFSMRGPRTCRRWFLRGAARRLLGAPNPPSRGVLLCLWLLAPARAQTWSLLRSALVAERRSELVPRSPDLAGARSALLELMRLPRGVVTRAELRSSARAWQTVFESGEVRELITARREQLQGMFDPDTVAARFEGEVIALLAEFWRDSLADAVVDADEPRLILAAKDQLQGELLGELESLCAALPRGKARTTEDLEQHWREWARVRYLAERMFDALPDRGYLVFDSAGGELLNHAAWLFNQQHAHILAHDIFRFLSKLVPKGNPNQPIIERNVKLSV